MDPLKASVLLGIAICLWIFFSVVPMKVMLCAMVVVRLRIGISFRETITALLTELPCRDNMAVHKKSRPGPSPVGIWINNAF